jgi:glutathione S-transferase
MASAPRFRLHHAPQSRAFRILWLLEECGASYERVAHDLRRGTQKAPGFLALNRDGKLPVLEDRGPSGGWEGVVVTESLAICAYVADATGTLAPAVGTAQRAAYQTFLAYGGTVLEPSMADLAFPRAAPPPPASLGWPPFAEAVARVEGQVTASGGPYLLGAAFTAADVMCGGMLRFAAAFGILKPAPRAAGYLAALEARPAMARALGIEEAALAAAGTSP